MKKTYMFTALALITLIAVTAFGKDKKLTAAEILVKMDEIRNYETAKMAATMRIINRKGRETKMTLVSYERKEGDKSIMRFTSPARLKGTAILTVDDNIWYYNKRTNRARLLSRSAKKGSMMGSSFSYEDMSTNYVKDFSAGIISENKDSYVLKLFPKKKKTTYVYLKAFVQKKNFIATKVEYAKKNDLIYKILTSENIVDIDGHIFPLLTTMKDIGAQKVTEFEVDEKSAEFDMELEENIFSERNLKRQ